MKARVLIQGGTISPLYSSDKKAIEQTPDGRYTVSIKRHRNKKHHDKFLAIIRTFVRNTSDKRFSPKGTFVKDESAAINAVIIALKYELGITEEVPMIDGEVRIIPGHINFEQMDQDEFEEKVYPQSVQILAGLLGCTTEELEESSSYNL